ncbi:MAG: endolytic transglycosylase MltG [Patescibacteria group bacterium]
MFKLFSRFFYGVLLGAIFLIALIFLFFILSFNSSLNIDKKELFEIKQGQSLSKILNEAKDKGLIKSNISLLLYAVLSGIDREIQFGVYELKPGMNSYDFLLMISGKGDYVIKGNKITILEGYTIDDIFNVFQKNDIDINYDIFINIDNNLRKKYSFLQDIPENASLEGFLFPDTYYISEQLVKNNGKLILEKFLDNFESKITNEIKNGFEKQGLNFYKGLILASIVESEVWNKNDKPIVASVLLNRLRVKMPLQVDSTIIYSLKSNGNNNFLTPKKTLGEQFLDTKSLYNTYKNSGLPPGPISNPGLDSLLSVANAPDTSFWYYLSKQDTGETIFSKNLDEHNKNRFKYLK